MQGEFDEGSLRTCRRRATARSAPVHSRRTSCLPEVSGMVSLTSMCSPLVSSREDALSARPLHRRNIGEATRCSGRSSSSAAYGDAPRRRVRTLRRGRAARRVRRRGRCRVRSRSLCRPPTKRWDKRMCGMPPVKARSSPAAIQRETFSE